jgi:hypothetical protein
MAKRNKRNSPVENKPKITMAAPRGLCLDLGCGATPRDGFEGVDINGDKATHRVDLFKFPWPWADDSVDEINCSHFAEHIPAREVEERDIVPGENARKSAQRFVGVDMFFAFFDECWRIMKKDAWMTVIVPALRNNRAFQDPTHRRFICEETFIYFLAEWRKVNIPQYRVRCNFETQVNSTISGEVALKAAEVQGQMIRHQWNVAQDIVAKMKAVK